MDNDVSLARDLPSPRDDGAAAHLRGAPMPDLSLRTTSGTTVRLPELPGPRAVVFVYPSTARPGVVPPDGWDDIPGARGSTPEACSFRDHHEDLRWAGAAAVYGLSSQNLLHQREAVARLHLPFPLISDPHLDLAGMLGLPTFRAGDQRFFRRLTLVVTGGAIEHVFHPVFPPAQHAGQVLTWLLGS